jgi:hypothetical protein
MTAKPYYITRGEYARWMAHSYPGQMMIYLVGYLPSSNVINDVKLVASQAWRDANVGLVHLTQKRLGDKQYEYRVTKARPPKSVRPRFLSLVA